jgi:hypothetical protein
MWQELYGRICDAPPLIGSMRNLIDVSFATAEQVLNIRFPKSYRGYAINFGPGRLARYFDIAVPGDSTWGPRREIVKMNSESVKYAPLSFIEEIHLTDIERIQRMIYFAETEDGDMIGWDPTELVDSTNLEYKIYFLPRRGPPSFLVGAFDTFIGKVCLGSLLPKLLPYDASEWGGDDRQCFSPFRQT